MIRKYTRVVSIALPALVAAMVTLSPAAVAQDHTTAKTVTPGAVTFAKDVAPIFQRACQNCHRPGSIAPMPLLTYEDARPWAKSIKQKVTTRTMPPWYIDKNVGIHDFKNDVSLSDEEIATIAAWVDAGSPKGNVADMPTPRVFEENDRWHIGTPDLIVSLPKDEFLAARAPDTWKDILVDPHLTEDRWIQAVETKPTKGYNVVHHAATSLVVEDEDGHLRAGGAQGTVLNEYAVGKNGDVFAGGAARLIKAGTKINFNIHLHANGKDTPLNLSLALKFYPKGYVPKHVELTENVGYRD